MEIKRKIVGGRMNPGETGTGGPTHRTRSEVEQTG